MSTIILGILVFISDVQINQYDPYPMEHATTVSSVVGGGTVYDCGDLSENGILSEYDVYRDLFPLAVAGSVTSFL